MKFYMEELIDGCKNGKQRARNELFRMYRSKLLGICLRYTRDKSEAEDVLLEGFIQIYKKIGSFENKGSFEGWMKRIMVNTAIDYFRKHSRDNFHQNIDDYEGVIPSDLDMLNNMHAKDLLELIQSMPPGYRMVFNLFALEGFSHKEIAIKLGITESTSKSQIRKARFWLIKKIETNFD